MEVKERMALIATIKAGMQQGEADLAAVPGDHHIVCYGYQTMQVLYTDGKVFGSVICGAFTAPRRVYHSPSLANALNVAKEWRAYEPSEILVRSAPWALERVRKYHEDMLKRLHAM